MWGITVIFSWRQVVSPDGVSYISTVPIESDNYDVLIFAISRCILDLEWRYCTDVLSICVYLFRKKIQQ